MECRKPVDLKPLTHSSHKISFTFEDWIPSLTLRQIYSIDNFYAQLYEKIGITGVTAGFATSKIFEISEKLTFKTLLKSNFTHVNLENVLTYTLTPNLDWDFKLVSKMRNQEILG
jgi:hypothetical protein